VDHDGGKLDASRIMTGADRKAIDQLTLELEEQRELAANRLAELVSPRTRFIASLGLHT
jgi:hypothetical protein